MSNTKNNKRRRLKEARLRSGEAVVADHAKLPERGVVERAIRALLPDDARNFLVLLIGSVLNFSFAGEKLCNVLGYQQTDLFWFFVYGGLGLVLTLVAVYDWRHDMREGKKTSVERII